MTRRVGGTVKTLPDGVTVVLATVVMCGRVGLELAGILSSLKPQLLVLSRTGTLLFVLLLNASR